MRKITYTLIILFSLLIIPFVQAQDAYELPAAADGDTITDSFEENITARLYAFYGSSGDSVTINMVQASNDLDPFLILLDTEGAVLAYDDDSGSTSLSASLSNVALEDDGIYFVMATSLNFADGDESTTNDELPYQISFSGQSTPNGITDDSIITLEDIQVLVAGNSITGEATEDNPAALFFFEGANGDDVTISLQNAEFAFTVLHVLDPDGSRIAVDPSITTLTLEQDGVYLVIATEQFFYEAMDDGSFFEGGAFVLVIE